MPCNKFDDSDAGFKVAPGDQDDIEVTNAHPWECDYLVFSDVQAAGTTLGISWDDWCKGKQCFAFKSMNPVVIAILISGCKGWNRYTQDKIMWDYQHNAMTKVGSSFTHFQVLLRKRANVRSVIAQR
jgi:hypothetical protein